MWSDEVDSSQIFLGENFLPVRQNLWTLLRRLQWDGQTGSAWADVACSIKRTFRLKGNTGIEGTQRQEKSMHGGVRIRLADRSVLRRKRCWREVRGCS